MTEFNKGDVRYIMGKSILIIEDEQTIVDIIKINLEKDGYTVYEAHDGAEGVQTALEKKPDLILLDIMLPKLDGFEVCKRVREKMSTPIIMLTARDEELDKVLGLELGADDYMTKPFSVRELSARVKAHLRRMTIDKTSDEQASEQNVITAGELIINTERYEVVKNGKIVDITLREFELLQFLASQPNKLISRDTLLKDVWGYDYLGDVRTVDVTVRRLREKIEDDPSAPKFIMTKRGKGYYFNK